MKISIIVSVLVLLLGLGQFALAQENPEENSSGTSTPTSTTLIQDGVPNLSNAANLILEKRDQITAQDKTQPEELPEKVAVLSLFEARKVDQLSVFSFIAYWVQEAVSLGVPANTIFLILLAPILALIVSFVRIIIGLSTFDMWVPIALAFVFVAIGVTVGMLVLGVILLASYASKVSLKGVRIMFYPKRSLSILFLSIFVLIALMLALTFGFDRIASVSIFPILVLMLLGDTIVSAQLTKSGSETLSITFTTILLGLVGYSLAVSGSVRDILLLYPEIVLLTIPLNLLIGRYFGLRVVEYFRFNNLSD